MAELRQSRRVWGLPHDFIPISGENPMEAIDQRVATNSQVGENVVAIAEIHILRTPLPWSNNLLEVILHFVLP